MLEEADHLELIVGEPPRTGVVAVSWPDGHLEHLPLGQVVTELARLPAEGVAPTLAAWALLVRDQRRQADGGEAELARSAVDLLGTSVAARLGEAVADLVSAAGSEGGRRRRAHVRIGIERASSGWELCLGLAGSNSWVSLDRLPAAGTVEAARLGARPTADARRGLRTLAAVWPWAAGRWPGARRPAGLEQLDTLAGPVGTSLGLAGIEVAWPGDRHPDAGVGVRAVLGDRPLGHHLSTPLRLVPQVQLHGSVHPLDGQSGLVEVEGNLVRVPALPLAPRLVDLVADPSTAPPGAEELAARLAGAGQTAAAPPRRLATGLLDHQKHGLHWLETVVELGCGGVLADDMGLGKTVQIIAVHLARREQGQARGPTVVICPTSVMEAWSDQLARFAPGTIVHRFHGPHRSLSSVRHSDLVVTSYGTVRSDPEPLDALGADLVVADEAQAIKDPNSATARAVRSIRAGARLAVTGTPVENRVGDLWALLDWTTPGLLGSRLEFERTVARPLAAGDAGVAQRLQKQLAPVLLRRTKHDADIAALLPSRRFVEHRIELGPEQALLYRRVVEEALDHLAGTQGMRRRGRVLRLLTRCKQVCAHPSLLIGDHGPLRGRSAKFDRAVELTEEVVASGEQLVLFSQYVSLIELFGVALAEQGVHSFSLTGKDPASRRQLTLAAFARSERPVLLVSLRAGGSGLTLTAASQVIHLDRWWNPAVEDQASDRVWRIGQQRPVTVHHLRTAGTIEDRIDAVVRSKRFLADQVVGAAPGDLALLSDNELRDLVDHRTLV